MSEQNKMNDHLYSNAEESSALMQDNECKILDITDEVEYLKSELKKVRDELHMIKAKSQECESYTEGSLYGNIKKIGDQLYERQSAANAWRNTPLANINELKADPAGKLGEEVIKQICIVCDIQNESTGDKNSKDGTYDQKIGDDLKKVEIKTARYAGCKYQHETLKTDGYDYLMFVDIKPTGGCITILKRFDLTKKHPITGTTPTLRKGTTDVFKWDFTEKHLDMFVSRGYAIRFDKDTPMVQIGDFIRTAIV